jgi:hypothetical protein
MMKNKHKHKIIITIIIILLIILVVFSVILKTTRNSHKVLVELEEKPIQKKVLDEVIIEGVAVENSEEELSTSSKTEISKEDLYPDEDGFVSLSDFFPEENDLNHSSTFYSNFAKLIKADNPMVFKSGMSDDEIAELLTPKNSVSAIFLTPYEIENCDEGTLADSQAKKLLENWSNSVVYVAYDDFMIVEYNNFDGLEVVTYVP